MVTCLASSFVLFQISENLFSSLVDWPDVYFCSLSDLLLKSRREHQIEDQCEGSLNVRVLEILRTHQEAAFS